MVKAEDLNDFINKKPASPDIIRGPRDNFAAFSGVLGAPRPGNPKPKPILMLLRLPTFHDYLGFKLVHSTSSPNWIH